MFVRIALAITIFVRRSWPDVELTTKRRGYDEGRQLVPTIIGQTLEKPSLMIRPQPAEHVSRNQLKRTEQSHWKHGKMSKAYLINYPYIHMTIDNSNNMSMKWINFFKRQLFSIGIYFHNYFVQNISTIIGFFMHLPTMMLSLY